MARQAMGRPAAGAVRPRVGRRRDPRVAAVLSVVPGLGQLYNLQPVKAAFFLLATILTIGPAVLLITAGERLGTTLLHRGDGTAFLLLATLFTIGPSIVLIMSGERIGNTLLQRHQFTAFLLLSFASIIVFLAVFILGLAFWASAVVDARRTTIERNEGRISDGRWWFFRL